MGRIVMSMSSYRGGPGFGRFNNYTGDGHAKVGNNEVSVLKSNWDPEVSLTIRKSLAYELGIPEDVDVTIVWGEDR